MNRLFFVIFTVQWLCASAWGAQQTEPPVHPNDLPRFAPVPAEKALETFKVVKGFHLELVASEPNITSPVAVSFDENGRMYVVEMVDYSERREEVPHLGRIRLLEDRDGDGVYEKSTIFATNLAWPTAVFCYQGGVFVGATPDILYLKDTNGDGRADVRETVFTGFAAGVDKINVQELFNSFTWGLDNRIHGSTSGEGGRVTSPRHPEAPALDLHGRDFYFDPRNLAIYSEAGGGQHGLSFDNLGRRFTCNNSDQIRLFMYDDAYAARNPFYSMPSPLVSIGVDGPAAEVFRISPDEPWRVLRTRWRVNGLVSGPIEGGGRPSGYFTAATGVTIYRGNAYPPEFRGNAFIADCAGNLVHRKLLVADGVELKARRPDDEQKVEFAASRDTWFRPVQFAPAPDGTLYVIDMYREIIEHPWSLPDGIKSRLDLDSGANRGRIYRIAPDHFKPAAPPKLGRASTSELVATLASPDGWHRDTASRLLYERQDRGAVPLLNTVLATSSFPLARVHALSALSGLGALTETAISKALADADAGVREHAVKLAESFLRSSSSQRRLLDELKRMTTDTSVLVRYQLAFTLGELATKERLEPLVALSKTDAGNLWTRAAILSSLNRLGAEAFKRLSSDAAFLHSPSGQQMLKDLAAMIGAQNDPAALADVFQFLNRAESPELRFGLVRALGEGLDRTGRKLDISRNDLHSLLLAARSTAADTQTPDKVRAAAIQVVGLSSFAESGQLLLSLLNQTEPEPIQLSAIRALNHFTDPQLGPAILETWKNLTPRVQAEAISVLLARPDRAAALLQAMQNKAIRPAILSTTQTKFLRQHRDANVRTLAESVLDEAASVSRQKTVDAFMPALGLPGQAAAGKKIYEERCISCHRLGGEGNPVGPDLATVKNTGKEKILVNILDPNREVPPQYVSYVVETREGDSVVGLIAGQSSATVRIRQAYAKEEVISRAQIVSMHSQAQSLMPEGLETGLTTQDLANLLEYIQTADPEKVEPAKAGGTTP